MPDEELRQIMAAIEGDDPSPVFVAELRSQLEAELSDDWWDDKRIHQVTLVESQPELEKQQMNTKLWSTVAAVAAAIVVVVGIVAVTGDANDNSDTAVVTDETSPSTGDTTSMSTDEAMGAVGAYFDAYAVGDIGTALALFEPDTSFSTTWSGGGAEATLSDWEKLMTWNLAQGTVLTAPECLASEPVGDSVTVACEYGSSEALIQAIPTTPIPIALDVVVTPDGIRSWNRQLTSPDFTTYGDPFNRWVQANHPEDVDPAPFAWESVAEAQQRGESEGALAEEWGAFLEASGCDFNSLTCSQAIQTATAFVEARDAWDGEAVRALVADDAVIDDFVATPDEYLTSVEFERVTGWRFMQPKCLASDSGKVGEVTCTYTMQNAWSQALGVGPFSGSRFDFVIVGGEIRELTHTFDFSEFSPQVWEVMLAWVRDNHPDDVATMYDFTGSDDVPRKTPEAVALWEAYTLEFAESVAGS
ncbi:MAG: hypothetical protein ACC660_03095 [Acidimicrobiales bacterium]